MGWACIIFWCNTLWHKLSLTTQPMVQSVVSINVSKYDIFYILNDYLFFQLILDGWNSNLNTSQCGLISVE